MMSALGELGRTGLTAVGNSHEDAKATYERAVTVFDQETGKSLEERSKDYRRLSEFLPYSPPCLRFGLFPTSAWK